MEIIVNRVHDNPLIVIEKYYNPNELVLFDIETTGFAAKTTKLYLIGCCYFDNGFWFIKQWFNDDGESEALIIKDFMELILTILKQFLKLILFIKIYQKH